MFEYETPIFAPTEMLAVTGWAERNFQSMLQRGFFARGSRPGRGVRRRYSLSDLLFLSLLRLAVDAHFPLDEAAVAGMSIFPAIQELVPTAVMDVIRRGSGDHVFAVLHDGRAPVIGTGAAPLHRSEDWSITINISRLVSATVDAAEAVLAQRSLASR